MTKNYQRGFGFGTLVVIIALVLIVGGYIYYSGQNGAPAGSDSAYPVTGSEVPVTPAPGQQMETGEVVTPTGTSTNSGTGSSTASTTTR